MKRITRLLVLVLIASCSSEAEKKNNPDKEDNHQANTSSEAYQNLGIEEINRVLTENNKELTASEVMRLYRPVEVETGEGNEKIEVTEETLENGNFLVTLIHDNMMDDSVKGEQYKMELEKTGSKWMVVSVKKNWKCREGRGHTDWGTELCQ